MARQPSISYRNEYKYQLVENCTVETSIRTDRQIKTEWITLYVDGRLKIQAGYSWDGPSGPAIDTKSAMRGSLVHDALYQLIRLELLDATWREDADEEYRRICLEDGMNPVRAWLHFRALRRFGWLAAQPHADRPILTAP